jgi:hypothetical protein
MSPEDWNRALLWAIVAEDNKLRQLFLQARDNCFPLAAVVRPENAGWGGLDLVLNAAASLIDLIRRSMMSIYAFSSNLNKL